MAFYLANESAMAALAGKAHARFISIVESNRYASDFKTKADDLAYVDEGMSAHMPGLKESLPGFLKTLSAAHAGLAAKGIETLVHYPLPIPRQRAFEAFSPAECPVAAQVCAAIVSLPLHPRMENEDVDAAREVIDRRCHEADTGALNYSAAAL